MRLALFLLVLAVPAAAQEWVPLGAPPPLPNGDRCYIRSISLTSAGPVAVVTTPCGAFRKASGAWTRLGEARIGQVSESPDGTLFGVGFEEKPWRQKPMRFDEATGAWREILEGFLEPTHDAAMISVDHLIVDQGGSVWASAFELEPMGQIIGGLFVSTDGETWTIPDRDRLPHYVITALPDGKLAGVSFTCGFDYPCDQTSYIGRGTSWTLGSPTEGLSERWGQSRMERIVQTRTGEEPSYVASLYDQIIRSADGTLWEPTSLGNGLVFGLVSLPVQELTVASAVDGLFQSTDGGASWSHMPTPFDGGGYVTQIATDEDGTLYADARMASQEWPELYKTVRLLDTAEPAGREDHASIRVGPNPADGGAQVFYDVPETGRVRVEVFDVMGRSAGLLVDEVRPAGPHEATLPALAPGVYAVRLLSGGAVVSARVSVVR